jgi:hypothetical protein
MYWPFAGATAHPRVPAAFPAGSWQVTAVNVPAAAGEEDKMRR